MKCTYDPYNPDGPGDHDWMLVPQEYADIVSAEGGQRHWTHILWACPCSDFKWTNYAEWDGRQKVRVETTNNEGNTAKSWGLPP